MWTFKVKGTTKTKCLLEMAQGPEDTVLTFRCSSCYSKETISKYYFCTCWPCKLSRSRSQPRLNEYPRWSSVHRILCYFSQKTLCQWLQSRHITVQNTDILLWMMSVFFFPFPPLLMEIHLYFPATYERKLKVHDINSNFNIVTCNFQSDTITKTK
jgi:hypothetical protein